MGRHLGQLQRELHGMQKREEDRDRRTDLSLEAIEALVSARDEDSDRRFQEQAQENADRISKVRAPCHIELYVAFSRATRRYRR